MEPLQSNKHLPDDRPNPDPHRDCAVKRNLIRFVRSRWVASFIVATAVSWSFSEVDEKQTRKLEHQQKVLTCTIKSVADAQVMTENVRIAVRPILSRCEKQTGK